MLSFFTGLKVGTIVMLSFFTHKKKGLHNVEYIGIMETSCYKPERAGGLELSAELGIHLRLDVFWNLEILEHLVG